MSKPSGNGWPGRGRRIRGVCTGTLVRYEQTGRLGRHRRRRVAPPGTPPAPPRGRASGFRV